MSQPSSILSEAQSKILTTPCSTQGQVEELTNRDCNLMYTSNQVRILLSTLHILFNKNTNTPYATMWVDNKGIKIFTEERGVFQTIIFWQKDLFTTFADMANDTDLHIHFPMKEFLTFFETMNYEQNTTLTLCISVNNELLLQLSDPIVTARIKIQNIADLQLPTHVFDFNNYPTTLYLTCQSLVLLPIFSSLPKNHIFINFEASRLGELNINSGSPTDSIETIYKNTSFEHFECSQNISARYRLSFFKNIKKAVKRSKQVTLLINQNKLMYIECSFLSQDRNVNAEIAFYVSGQVDDLPDVAAKQEETQNSQPKTSSETKLSQKL
ncbi:hypothetical protein EIN_177940 [Entamoeba invadens IP1]|uniref:hypothetical protein n=1 Tax=Entamoeba invadens IP1 TaxID=370355 RepID=UPI0002C3E9A1|nr:hypothetical protein EIN_177940 [Entamoeba invadens IP1]ELP93887.1 hypothetical protein EIN_177940 [Entamoeba invadens IP1]|eukprot:XP_004260658.1 hypothetical protein EIN_177940 [Entamoeba invadens IP1]